MSDELVTWLRTQLDEVEVMARAAAAFTAGDRWIADGDEVFGATDEGAGVATAATWSHAAHIACHDPARVLAEVEAKRRIVDEHAGYDPKTWRTGDAAYDCTYSTWPCFTMRWLALPYADRPGYREEWRP